MQHPNGQAREDVLHRAVLGGDEGAWRLLYEAAYDGLLRYVHWRTGGLREPTEEIVQETWLVAVRRIASFDPAKGQFVHWVRGIAANVVRNHVRRQRLRNATQFEIEQEPQPNGDATARRDRAIQIAEALANLPEHYEAVLRAKYVDGQTVAEIAAGRGDSEKSVESLLTRARQAFRRTFKQQSDEGVE